MEGYRMNVLVLCADSLRHKYYALEHIQHIPDTKVIFEEKKRSYHSEFHKTEERFFLDYVEEHNTLLEDHIITTTENINNVYEEIKQANPQILSVHGTAIIKDPIIELFPKRILNLHAGLSPYYRGSGTNMFPFYNNELEYVGMTVHYLNKGIDSGEIILQGRPDFEETDNTHTIGCKNVILGSKLMIKVIKRYLDEGMVPSTKQMLGQGRLYLQKDFTEEVSIQIQQNLQNGIVQEYLRNQKHVDIIEW
jgi:methionyl-tRNA formyltransferase